MVLLLLVQFLVIFSQIWVFFNSLLEEKPTMKLSRRNFLKITGLGSASALAPRLLLAADASDSADDIISVFLRGAADGLNIIPPHGDSDYYRLRPGLAIAPPGNEQGALDLDGFFGFHPGMVALLPLYQSGELAVIHACGSPSPSHSHFEAQDLMERGLTGNSGSFSGWLGRYLDYRMDDSFSVFHALGMGNAAPRTLAHDASTIAMNRIEDFSLLVPEAQKAETEALLQALYAGDSPLENGARDTLAAVDTLAAADPAQYPPQNGATYPDTGFGAQLQAVGQLIRADVGVRATALSLGGWDTHQGESATLDNLLPELAQSLAAFHTDMGTEMDRITLVTMTEFGRRAYENGSAGTDHGHASFMLTLGGNVNGGRVYHDWPGLRDQDLYGKGDLQVSTDYRNVLGELIDKRTPGMPMELLFPDFDQLKRVFDLVKDFGTSQSPKSTRPLTTYWCPSRPGHQALRNNFASSLLLRTWLPYDWTPRSEAYFVFPLAQGTPGKQCGLAATGVYQPSLRSPWLAAVALSAHWPGHSGGDQHRHLSQGAAAGGSPPPAVETGSHGPPLIDAG